MVMSIEGTLCEHDDDFLFNRYSRKAAEKPDRIVAKFKQYNFGKARAQNIYLPVSNILPLIAIVFRSIVRMRRKVPISLRDQCSCS